MRKHTAEPEDIRPRTAMLPVRAALIESYLAALRANDPAAPMPRIQFAKGWFVFEDGQGVEIRRVRAAELVRMRDGLQTTSLAAN